VEGATNYPDTAIAFLKTLSSEGYTDALLAGGEVPATTAAADKLSTAPNPEIELMFWFVIRSIIHVDRNERTAYAKIEAEVRAAGHVEGPEGQWSDHSPPRACSSNRRTLWYRMSDPSEIRRHS
jgi:hypothetical protein